MAALNRETRRAQRERKMLKVTFITKAPYSHSVVEFIKNEASARIRAYALGWTIESIEAA